MGYGVGCSCICGKTVARLTVDGDVIWKRRRTVIGSPLATFDQALLYDEDNDRLYTLGSLMTGSVSGGTDDGYLMRWDDATNNPRLAWQSVSRPAFTPTMRNFFTAFGSGRWLALASDGYIWAVGDDTLGKFDPNDGQEIAQYTPPVGTTRMARIFPDQNGGVYILTEGSTSRVRRVDGDGVEIAATANFGVLDFVQVGSFIIAGFHPTTRYRKYDSNLTEVGSYSSVGEPAATRNHETVLMHALGDAVVATEIATLWPSSPALFRYARYEIAGMTQEWTNDTDALDFIPFAERVFSDDGVDFFHAFTLGVAGLEKRAGVDGSRTWTAPIKIPQAYRDGGMMTYGGEQLILAASSSVTPEESIILALSGDDGVENWRRVWQEGTAQRTVKVVQTDSAGGIFCCGQLSRSGF